CRGRCDDVPAMRRRLHQGQRAGMDERQAPARLARIAQHPVIGNLPVASIDTPLVLKVIKPLWERVPETASRVRGRIENILGWATVHHYRSGDNPARWSQHLEHVLPARSEVAKVEHHAALPYPEVPAFMAKLKQKTSVSAACLQFIALTAARRSEATE